MNEEITDHELEAFLDEALPAERMSALEQQLRTDKHLGARLAELVRRRDAGVHTLGAIWRRHRVSCPTREQLGSYLLQTLEEDEHQFVHFHLTEIGCRYCQANLEDLASQKLEAGDLQRVRRQRYFQSSAGYLHRKD